MVARRNIAVLHDDSDPVVAIVSVLQDGVAEIDRTFADVGARFGKGLDRFDGLKGRLLTLHQEITHPDLSEARRALAALAQELPKLEERLDHEKAALGKLDKRSQSVRRVFVALRSNMRLVSILTQRARIERASISGPIGDLETFTDEIVSLSRGARQVVEECARRHEDVAALIAVAADAQTEFERRFGRTLSGLATELNRVLQALEGQQAESVHAVGEMANHSATVIAATGNAVMALQTGDNIRQRLEHSVAALELAEIPVPCLPSLLFSLQAAQLQATGVLLSSDCTSVDQTILALGDATSRLIGTVRRFGGGGGGHASSSLATELEAGLATATELLRRCEADRRTVDEGMTKLTAFLEGFETTIASIRKTAVDIVFLGTNAGLRASHVGEGGRSLLVIAKELKIAADMVARDASELGDIFAFMLAAAADLRGFTTGSDRTALSDAAIQNAMQMIGLSGKRMSEILRSLDHEAKQFAAEIGSARHAFAAMKQRSRTVLEFAGRLEAMARQFPPPAALDALQPAADLINGQIYPLYSMAAERDVHREVMAGFGLQNGKADLHTGSRPEADAFEAF
jgi:hypothetical protein